MAVAERDGIYRYDEAPFNMRTEAAMAVRYALRQGWLTGSEAENLERVSYRVTGSRRECLFTDDKGETKGASLCISTTHDTNSDVLRSQVFVFADLVAGRASPMSLMAVLSMAPVYVAGDALSPQFELTPEAVNLRFSLGDTGFDFNFFGDGLVIMRNKGVQTITTEVLFNGVGWEIGGIQKLSHYLDPELANVPPVMWLRFLSKVLAGEMREKSSRKVKQKMAEVLISETSLMRKVFGSVPKRG